MTRPPHHIRPEHQFSSRCLWNPFAAMAVSTPQLASDRYYQCWGSGSLWSSQPHSWLGDSMKLPEVHRGWLMREYWPEIPIASPLGSFSASFQLVFSTTSFYLSSEALELTSSDVKARRKCGPCIWPIVENARPKEHSRNTIGFRGIPASQYRKNPATAHNPCNLCKISCAFSADVQHCTRFREAALHQNVCDGCMGCIR